MARSKAAVGLALEQALQPQASAQMLQQLDDLDRLPVIAAAVNEKLANVHLLAQVRAIGTLDMVGRIKGAAAGLSEEDQAALQEHSLAYLADVAKAAAITNTALCTLLEEASGRPPTKGREFFHGVLNGLTLGLNSTTRER